MNENRSYSVGSQGPEFENDSLFFPFIVPLFPRCKLIPQISTCSCGCPGILKCQATGLDRSLIVLVPKEIRSPRVYILSSSSLTYRKFYISETTELNPSRLPPVPTVVNKHFNRQYVESPMFRTSFRGTLVVSSPSAIQPNDYRLLVYSTLI